MRLTKEIKALCVGEEAARIPTGAFGEVFGDGTLSWPMAAPSWRRNSGMIYGDAASSWLMETQLRHDIVMQTPAWLMETQLRHAYRDARHHGLWSRSSGMTKAKSGMAYGNAAPACHMEKPDLLTRRWRLLPSLLLCLPPSFWLQPSSFIEHLGY